MKKNIMTIAISIVVIILVTAVVVLITSEDKTGPEITFNIPDGQKITYTSGQDKQALIKYAKAVDGKDGDVSDSLMIEDIYVASDLTTAKAVYVARDKSNNITKANREVKYIASKEEIDNLSKSNENATDAAGVSKQAATTSATVATTTKAEDTTKATTTSAKPVLTLSQSDATIKQGGNFNGASYVKDITDDKDDRSTLFRRIIVSGNYSTGTAGDYTISIYCTDTDGNASNTEKFTLHVQAVPEETQPETQPETQTETQTETHTEKQPVTQPETKAN